MWMKYEPCQRTAKKETAVKPNRVLTTLLAGVAASSMAWPLLGSLWNSQAALGLIQKHLFC